MKKCHMCRTSKPLTDFGVNRSRKDGLQSNCKLCKQGYNREYYASNPKRDERKVNKEALILRNRAIVYEYLSTHPCVDCGLTDWRLLEFDHVHDTKAGNISTMMQSYSVETLLTEISKCDVRCKNCHFLVTQERSNSWRVWYRP